MHALATLTRNTAVTAASILVAIVLTEAARHAAVLFAGAGSTPAPGRPLAPGMGWLAFAWLLGGTAGGLLARAATGGRTTGLVTAGLLAAPALLLVRLDGMPVHWQIIAPLLPAMGVLGGMALAERLLARD